jgi:hypothetical protein
VGSTYYKSEGWKMITEELVRNELRGDVSDKGLQTLHAYKAEWRKMLTKIKKELEIAIHEKKADLFASGSTERKGAEFNSWKIGPTKIIFEIDNRIRNLKDPNESTPMAPLLAEILEELRFISGLLIEKFGHPKDKELPL